MASPPPPDAAHLLVVDDDSRLRDLLRRFLEREGFRVTVAPDAVEARRLLKAMQFDLIVLDVMLPGESGLELTEAVRRERDIPVVLLTARGAPEDRIAGFERGADDYLAKPFEPRELLLRIRTILRRLSAAAASAASAGPVRLGDAVFDPARGLLTRHGEPVRLTSGEAALLAALAARAGETLTREDLAAALGQEDHGERAIDVQVTRLRRKIERDPREPAFLQTVRGRGYVLRPG
ncbi:response regulator transcription factor [Elioraea tepida]|jgi:two-component system phosphate regulon response regulator OmpR|uniref:Response regulator transcription factor n=1 Tax=Elioraea tepida TaxID=2843330 RepID=A0A975YKK5_9PROT|nr:response regulator transcription factor [Elioraea tepida]QXM25855.1 response regulator transcription factor [Elioraea tepida]